VAFSYACQEVMIFLLTFMSVSVLSNSSVCTLVEWVEETYDSSKFRRT